MRLALVALLALAACAAPLPPLDPTPSEPPPAGLTLDQLATLRALPIPVLVPGDVGTFELVRFDADARGATGTYGLGYRRSDGACFEVTGSNDGLGGPDWPLVSTEARVRNLGRSVRVYQAADDPAATSAQVWGVGTVVSDFIDMDGAGILFLSDTQGGCRPVPLDDGVALVASLRRLSGGAAPLETLEPTEPSALGEFAPAPDLLEDYNAASSPDAAAEAIARRYDAAASRVWVESLGQSDSEARVLVTALDLPDDSIRDERLLLTYRPYGPTWELVEASRQVRCQPGRGHTEWDGGACL